MYITSAFVIVSHFLVALTNTLAFYVTEFIKIAKSLMMQAPGPINSGACIIKLITAVIYVICNKLECLSLASLSSLV